jgi:hypothetical protein
MCNSKEVEEKQIFMSFASVCPMNIRLNSIENRKYPEPDILCKSVSLGWISFEMTRLDYEDFLQVTNEKRKLREEFRASYEKLSRNVRGEILAKFGDFSVSVAFTPELSPGKWRRAIPFLLDALQKAPSTAVRKFPIQDYPGLQEHVTEVKIRNGDGDTPAIPSLHIIAPTEKVNRSLERLDDKFRKSKRYKTEHPIELLAYYDLQPAPQSLGWAADIEKYVAENLGNSQFRRVWIFDCLDLTIKFRHPLDTGELVEGCKKPS